MGVLNFDNFAVVTAATCTTSPIKTENHLLVPKTVVFCQFSSYMMHMFEVWSWRLNNFEKKMFFEHLNQLTFDELLFLLVWVDLFDLIIRFHSVWANHWFFFMELFYSIFLKKHQTFFSSFPRYNYLILYSINIRCH